MLHTHTSEDHNFIILRGQARFHDRDGTVTELGRNQGIMLPRGAYYWFQSRGDEPLVLLRVAGKGERQAVPRLGADGRPLPEDSRENKHEKPVPIPGAFYE